MQCGTCPEGFAGNGYDGCKPQLTNLTISAGMMVPDFSPEVAEYTWVTGMANAATNFTPSASGGVTVRLDDQAIAKGEPTDSISLLPYEDRTRVLELSAQNDLRTEVSIRTRRDWLWSDTLRASNRDQGDEFGRALAIVGDMLVVGARSESSNIVGAPENDDKPGSGAAYVFDLGGATPKEGNILKEEIPGDGHAFGTSVAATADLIAVGAPGEGSTARGIDNPVQNEDAPGSGVVWTFALGGGEWQWSRYVKSDNSDASDRFGTSVAVDGDWLIVGAPGEQSASPSDPSDNSIEGAGAAYVFKRTATALQQVAYLKAPHPSLYAEFGYGVAVSEGFFAVSARGDDRAGRGVVPDDGELTAVDSGAVFVFRVQGDDIVFDAHIKASNADAGDTFGYGMALSGSRLVVGASGEGSGATDPTGNGVPGAGAVYVFERAEGTWSEVALIKSPRPREYDSFGRRVAFCGDSILIGAPGQASSAGLLPTLEDEAAPASGALFVARPDPWRIVSTLKPRVSQEGSALGTAVACRADLIVGGAHGESGVAPAPSLGNAGAVQLYR